MQYDLQEGPCVQVADGGDWCRSGDIEVDLALLVATHAGLALSAAREATSLRTAVHSRHVIGMAQGILMERYALDAGQAFGLLRRYSNTLNTRLHDIAEEVVASRELPVVDHES